MVAMLPMYNNDIAMLPYLTTCISKYDNYANVNALNMGDNVASVRMYSMYSCKEHEEREAKVLRYMPPYSTLCMVGMWG